MLVPFYYYLSLSAFNSAEKRLSRQKEVEVTSEFRKNPDFTAKILKYWLVGDGFNYIFPTIF